MTYPPIDLTERLGFRHIGSLVQRLVLRAMAPEQSVNFRLIMDSRDPVKPRPKPTNRRRKIKAARKAAHITRRNRK